MATLLPLPLAAQSSPLDGFDAYVEQAVRDWEAPGLAVAVVEDGEVVFAEGYGVRELGRPGAVDVHTLFAIGSTTKAMTAAAVGMLVDDGKLAWDDAVVDHLPWFRLHDPQATREVTPRDLLTHRAGLGNADFLWYEQDNTTEDIVRALRHLEPAYSMRSSFIYQNIMYAAAGELIEAVSGMSWDEFIRSRIFEPLEMTRSVTRLTEADRSDNVARPHDRVDGRVRVISNASVDAVAAAGSVWSSVHDMSRWVAFLLRGCETEAGQRLLQEHTCEELFVPQAIVGRAGFYPTARLTKPSWNTYGLAWFQADYEGRKVDFHTGSIDGMVALAGLIRDEGIGVYVLGNLDHAELRHALMYRVFDLYDADPPRDWSAELKELYDALAAEQEEAAARSEEGRAQGTSPSLDPEAYSGTYTDELYGTVRITFEDGSLRAHYGRLTGPMEHWHYDTFRVEWDARWRGHAMVSFSLDAGGSVAELRLGRSRFRRAEEEAPGGAGAGSGLNPPADRPSSRR